MAPTPTVTATRTFEVSHVTANGDVADGPELRDISDRPFLVDHISACWTRRGDGKSWWLEWVKVSGLRQLKSGTRSATRLYLHYDTVDRAHRPDWVSTWLAANEPAKTKASS